MRFFAATPMAVRVTMQRLAATCAASRARVRVLRRATASLIVVPPRGGFSSVADAAGAPTAAAAPQRPELVAFLLRRLWGWAAESAELCYQIYELIVRARIEAGFAIARVGALFSSAGIAFTIRSLCFRCFLFVLK